MSAKMTFVSWAARVRRSEGLARALGAKAFYVEIWKGCALPLLPVRYLLQAVKTWRILRRERPDVVLTMNPPPFLPLVACLYSRLHGARFVIDSHTGALVGRRWARLLFLHRFLSRRAVTTLVTNEVLAAQVSAWGASAFILELDIPDFPPPEETGTGAACAVAVINSYSPDEPQEAIRAAAAEVPECTFYVTGKIPAGLRPSLESGKPSNVVYTDYLPDDRYLRLLRRARAIMVLVTADHTLLQGAAEAVALEKPLITSDWPVLRAYFRKGALYVDNRPESIARAVREAVRDGRALAGEMHALRQELKRSWTGRVGELAALITRDRACVPAEPVSVPGQQQAETP
jgi:glycosyltransferase involved in cell wall biosynthesis